MLTIGQYFKSERHLRKMTLSQLEEITKIKKDFLKYIEAENWQSLPEYPVVLGFVKNIAAALEIDPLKVAAFLRRDYPPQKMNMNPKPDLPKEFRFGPRLTFFIGVGIVLVVLVGYLVVQYVSFIRPPSLEVYEPTQDQIVKKTELKVIGKTDSDATVKVNNQPVLVSDTGLFETELEIFEGTTVVEVVSVSRSGKESRVSRTINPQLIK